MKVACLALLDNGNFMRHAARGLRDYCQVDATAFHGSPDHYLHIPDDTVQPFDAFNTDDYDVFLLNDHTYYAYHHVFQDQPRLVKCNGTWAKAHRAWLTHDYTRHDTLYLSSPLDVTVARALPFSIQTLPPLIDTRLLPPPRFPDDTITVGHAPTSKRKGTPYILDQLYPYTRTHTIDVDVITDTPWTDAIQRKAQCHIFIDQATQHDPDPTVAARGAIGVNALESLALGSLVLANPLHPYVHHHFPDITEYIERFPHRLEWAINWAGTHPFTDTATRWAEDHFDIKTQAPRLHDWLQEVIE